MSEREWITPTELAEEMGISPKNLRRFIRSITAEHPGKGNRWEIDREIADEIKSRYKVTNRKRVAANLTPEA